MNMRERLAMAIHQRRNGHGAKPWAHQPKTHQEPYLTDADAVLDELMTPTEGMIDAMAEDMWNGIYAVPADKSVLIEISRTAIPAMIKAAKEGK